jgi:hypothetical protein
MKFRWLAALLFALCLAPPLLPAGGPKGEENKTTLKVYNIPYRLTDTQHVMVRVKLNGKGPYNFIVDTGAPLLYVSTPIAKKAGLSLKDEKKGGEVIVLDRFEIEGGASQSKIKCLIETPFQLKGMNAFGMAGDELHGIIGYSVLSHYRMEFDFKRDAMVWTRLDFKPLAPIPLGIKNADPTGMEKLGGLMEAMALLMGKKPPPPPAPRGFLGVELAEKNGDVVASKVLEKSPAAAAGLKAGDRIREVQGHAVFAPPDVLRHVARVKAGQTVRLSVRRGDEKKEITITAGEGL